MLGLSNLGLLALVTSGSEFGLMLVEKIGDFNDALKNIKMHKRNIKYHDNKIEITEALEKHNSILMKMEDYLSSDHDITKYKKFCPWYMTIKKLEQEANNYFTILMTLHYANPNESCHVVNIDKKFMEDFRKFKTTVNMIEVGLKALEKSYEMENMKKK